jgi:AAA family ATP:ADP antiporter
MLAWLARVLRVDPSELALVRPLLFQHFLLIAAITLAKTGRDSLYLSDLPVQFLPYVFFGLAVWTVIATYLFGRLFASLPTHVVLARSNAAVAFSLLAFAAWFWLAPGAPAVAFYIWLGAYGILLVSQFWILAAERINPRQARRLFTLIGAGGILGGIVGGLLAAAQGLVGPPQWLLLIAGALHALAVPLATRSGRRREEAPPSPRGFGQVEETGMRRALQHPFVRTLGLIFLVAAITTTVLEYQFKLLVQGRITDAGALTSFFGTFYWVQSLLALGIQLLLTRWFLYRFGARAARSILPAGILVGSSLALVLPAFVPVLLTRLYDTTLRISLFRTAAEFLFFPLSESIRRQAKRLVDAVASRAAEAISGALILAINFLMGGSLVQFSVLLCLLSITWLYLSHAAYQAYVRELSRSLRGLLFGAEVQPVSLREAGVLNELYSLLDSKLENRVLYAMDVLSGIDLDRLRKALPSLFRHASPRVRAQAVELAAEDPTGLSLAEVERLLSDGNDDVRMNASYVYCQLAPGDPAGNIMDLTKSESALIRSGALQCIASHSPSADDEKVDTVVEEYLKRGTQTDRLAVARAVGRRPAPTVLERHLFTLIWDSDLSVRRAALLSTGQVTNRELVPTLIERLALPDESDASRDGLALYGERVVGTLSDHLLDPSVPEGIRREIPAIFARVGSETAVAGLVRAAGLPERVISYRALKALNKVREKGTSTSFPVEQVTEQMGSDAKEYRRLVQHHRSVAGMAESSSQKLLMRVLRERTDQTLERLFRKLGLLYPSREAYLAYQGVTNPNERIRTQSIEYLETILSPEHRRITLPVIERFDRAAWRVVAGPRTALSRDALADILSDLASRADPWLLSAVIFNIGAMKVDSLGDLVVEALKSRDPIVKDTASWAQTRLAES